MGTREAISEVGKLIGFRFIVVSLLPMALLIIPIIGLLLSGAPSELPDIGKVMCRIDSLSVSQVAFIIIWLFVISIVTHPLQLSIVRLVEGYWENLFPLNHIRPRLLKYQKNLRDELEKNA